jgi:hypothetical protein
MANLPRPIAATRLVSPTGSRQLSIAFTPTRGIPPTERATRQVHSEARRKSTISF